MTTSLAPFTFDDATGGWIASSAAAVTAVLAHPDCRVRPMDQPVPPTLVGTAAGDLFAQLVRMTDGPHHTSLKAAVRGTVDGFDDATVATVAERWAEVLIPMEQLERIKSDKVRSLRIYPTLSDVIGRDPSNSRERFPFDLPVYVVGTLLGAPAERLPAVARWTGDLVAAIGPAATPTQEDVERGSAAATALLALFGDANRIGLLTQSYAATAGLIENTVASPAARAWIAAGGDVVAAVREVARLDAPVQHTRRWVARDTEVLGKRLRAGDAILVGLAAANRDPEANANPEAFDPTRANPRCFTFGASTHRCPGERIAVAIAAAGVARLLGVPR